MTEQLNNYIHLCHTLSLQLMYFCTLTSHFLAIMNNVPINIHVRMHTSLLHIYLKTETIDRVSK